MNNFNVDHKLGFSFRFGWLAWSAVIMSFLGLFLVPENRELGKLYMLLCFSTFILAINLLVFLPKKKHLRLFPWNIKLFVIGFSFLFVAFALDIMQFWGGWGLMVVRGFGFALFFAGLIWSIKKTR